MTSFNDYTGRLQQGDYITKIDGKPAEEFMKEHDQTIEKNIALEKLCDELEEKNEILENRLNILNINFEKLKKERNDFETMFDQARSDYHKLVKVDLDHQEEIKTLKDQLLKAQQFMVEFMDKTKIAEIFEKMAKILKGGKSE